jgi:chromate reductase, NAD(P)H dehydrogenase (quinone)
MNILVIPGSSSRYSINKRLAVYAASLFEDANHAILDLNDFEMPVFSVDKEKADGNQLLAQRFLDHIADADFIILSLAEHNGSYSAAFKNILDWSSRINGKVWQDKPMLLMATSPGRRGAASVLDAALNKFPFMGADIRADFSLPMFNENFDTEQMRIIQPELDQQLREIVRQVESRLK